MSDAEAAKPAVCPACSQPIRLGESILRDDDVRVHIECFDGVSRWEPHTPDASR